ncbi:hypothetical protein RI367_006418 [Sorochytrium milnesiophthora]
MQELSSDVIWNVLDKVSGMSKFKVPPLVDILERPKNAKKKDLLAITEDVLSCANN